MQDLVLLENLPLVGTIEYFTGRHRDSHVIRVYYVTNACAVIYVKSFGNYRRAEDRILDLLEYPHWTILKYA